MSVCHSVHLTRDWGERQLLTVCIPVRLALSPVLCPALRHKRSVSMDGSELCVRPIEGTPGPLWLQEEWVKPAHPAGVLEHSQTRPLQG